MLNFKISKSDFILYNSLLFFTFYYLFPLIQSGYIGDDLYNSQIRGRLFYDNLNIFEFYLIEAKSWYWDNGRLFPISACMYFLFYFVENVITIKFFYSVLILLNLFLFSKIIFYFTNSKKVAILSYLLILSSFQFRLWHDPILSFHGLMQTLLLFLLISIFYFLKYQKTKKVKLYENISLIFFLLSLLTYEISYYFISFFFFLDYQKTRSLKKSLFNIKKYIFLFISILILVSIAKVKIHFTGENYYKIVSDDPFNVINVCWAFLIQLFSSFNLTYSLAHIYKYDILHLKHNFLIFDLFFIFFTFSLFRFCIEKVKIKNLNKILIICFLLWIPSALMVSLSSHQEELINVGLPAVGYLPIYIQYFGSAVLIYLFFYNLFKKTSLIKNTIYIIFPVVLTISTYMHLLTNREVVNMIGKNESERVEMKKILKKGILDNLNDGDLVIREMKRPHDWMWFYAKYAKKRLVFCDLSKSYLEFCYPYHAFNEVKNTKNQKKIFYVYNQLNQYNGEYNYFLAEINAINLEKKSIEKININNIKYYDNKSDKIIYINKNLKKNFPLNIEYFDLFINNEIKR